MNRYKEELELIDELNEQISDNKYLENLGVTFSFLTNGFQHQINFGNFTIYCSENDSLCKYDELSDQYVDITLKDFVIDSFNKLKEELYNVSLTEIK